MSAAEELHPGPQFSMIAKLGTRLGELLDEDQWAECEAMLLQIENGPWRSLAADPATASAPCGLKHTRGYHALVQVLYELKEDGQYSDDEGEETAALAELLAVIEKGGAS